MEAVFGGFPFGIWWGADGVIARRVKKYLLHKCIVGGIAFPLIF